MFTRMRVIAGVMAALLIVAGLVACSEVADPPVAESSAATAGSHLTYDCAAQSSIPEVECDALVALYDGTDGDNWDDNAGWLNAGDPCSWYGITCETGAVTEIWLIGNELSGSIPSELGGFSSLHDLVLNINRLSGSIPPELGDLSSLENLQLAANELSGSIPSELGSLASLQNLALGDNQLSGPVPPELGNLTSLGLLGLGENRLSGPIPPQLGSLASLLHLQLDGNDLSGPIPSELGDITGLLSLYLSFNQLSGPIPPELGDLTSLTALRLDMNALSGQVPLPVAQVAEGLFECSLENNLGLFMPDTQPYRDADASGDGTICRMALGADTDGDGIPDALDPDIPSAVVATLPDAAFHSGGNRNALMSRLDNIEADIAAGDTEMAVEKLMNLRTRVDGCGAVADTNDWIVDCPSQVIVRDLIDTLIARLET